MYNPKQFKSDDIREAFELMDKHPFATVISVSNGEPIVSHLPLTPLKDGNAIILIGHLARANLHWKTMCNGETNVIFHGPHAYITPMWYTENDVPTWNYSVVHAKGQAELIDSYDGIVQCLQNLSAHAEKHWPSGWEFFIPDDLTDDVLTKSIVGFKIKIQEIKFKKKLSQNRSPADRAGILRGLQNRSDEGSRLVLQDMLRLHTME